MSIVVTPIPRLVDLAAPAFTLGTANAAGSATTAVASDSTLLAFDTTVPTTIAYSASAAAGSAVVTSRRDHTHGMAAEPSVAVSRVGGQTSVSSTTSTSVVDLISLSGLSVGINDPIKFLIATGKALGTGAVSFGVKFNTTVLVLAVAGGATLVDHSAANAHEMGVGVYDISPRMNNYHMLTGYQKVVTIANVDITKSLGPIEDVAGVTPLDTMTAFKITAITAGPAASCGSLEVYNFTG
jgi:hypothetical protein